MNDPNIIFQNMHRVFRAMVVLELPNKSEYTKGLLMNLIFMHHNKRQNTPMWQAWKQDPSAWNEEKGESALGTLARIQNGRGNGTKLDVTNAKWAMIHQHSVVGNGFMNETMDWDNADRPVIVEKDSASVLHTRTWLERTIHQLHTNQLRVCTDRDLLAFEDVAQQNLAPAKKIAVFLEMDFEAQVRKRLPAFTKQQVSFWVDKDSPKDIHGNTKADRQLAWPVPAGAPQPADAVLDAADQNSCSDDSADADTEKLRRQCRPRTKTTRTMRCHCLRLVCCNRADLRGPRRCSKRRRKKRQHGCELPRRSARENVRGTMAERVAKIAGIMHHLSATTERTRLH